MATQKKTANAWKAAAAHDVTLPSGTVVKIRIPNLPLLVKTGQLPNELVTEALSTISDPDKKLTPEAIAQSADFYAKLLTVTVIEPEITEDDIPDIPFEDVEWLVELATRQRDQDALGHHIAGLHKNKDWRTFRGLDGFYEDVESV